jgi:UDP-N-acetylmuramoyl-tripeptide--D-alanyl-D-alanine ligase
VIKLSLGEITTIVGGRLHEADPATLVTGSVEYDSRAVTAGGLFLALPGERADGHDFAAAVYARGAVAVIATRAVDGPRIEVGDGVAAITALAAAVAARLPATVVGITGSSGKTSTKDLLAQVLGDAGPTVAPSGSMNNELGHPYTVLRADLATSFLVLEMGARGVGHIRHLAEIAPPRIGVVLNIGSAHLGEFGSRQATALAKGELVEALPAEGVAVLNADDPLVAAMASRTRARVLTFGESGEADVRAKDIEVDELGRASFTLHIDAQAAPVSLRVVGEHQVSNALAAASVAAAVGRSVHEIALSLSAAVAASRWRMEITERDDGVLIINDAYNANPESMRAALKTLASLARSRRDRGARSFAVLGPMGELGPTSPEEHDALGRLAVRLDISQVIAVGELAKPIQHGAALEGSWNEESLWVADVDAAVALLRELLAPGDVVLVKASRAASLERVALAIAEDAHAAQTDTNSPEGGHSA